MKRKSSARMIYLTVEAIIDINRLKKSDFMRQLIFINTEEIKN